MLLVSGEAQREAGSHLIDLQTKAAQESTCSLGIAQKVLTRFPASLKSMPPRCSAADSVGSIIHRLPASNVPMTERISSLVPPPKRSMQLLMKGLFKASNWRTGTPCLFPDRRLRYCIRSFQVLSA